MMVLAAHIWARTANPCDSKYSDLDIVASLGLFSFGWLALGNATGWNAVSFYGISAMGLAMGLSVLAWRGNLLIVTVIAGALFAIRSWVVNLNPEASNWAEPLMVLSALTLTVTAALPQFAPQLFIKDRVLRLTLVALALPLAYYLWSVAGSWGERLAAGATS